MLRQLTYNHLFCYLYVYYYQYVGGNDIEVYDAKIPIEATTRLVCSP